MDNTTIYINKYAATEQDKLPELAKSPAVSLPMVIEMKAFDRSNLSEVQRTTDNYSNQEKPKGSLQRTILSPCLPASCFCDLGQPPVSWSSLCYIAPSCPNTRKEQSRTKDARREMGFKPPHAVFRSSSQMFHFNCRKSLCSYARGINKLHQRKVTWSLKKVPNNSLEGKKHTHLSVSIGLSRNRKYLPLLPVNNYLRRPK